MQLTPRLEAVKKAVTACDTVLDAGTDHAYVPIALVQQGICRKAIAADINPGPLQRAEAHIAKNNMKDSIEIRLGSGLTVVAPGEVQSVILAGMGGVLIAQLLQETPSVTGSVERFVLQPMNGAEYLRHYLHDNHFRIMEEYLAEEGDKIYVILCVEHGEEQYEKECYYHIGKTLWDKYEGQPILEKYIHKKQEEFCKMLEGQKRALQKDDEKISYLETLLKELEGFGCF